MATILVCIVLALLILWSILTWIHARIEKNTSPCGHDCSECMGCSFPLEKERKNQ